MAVILTFVGMGASAAMQQPPFVAPDESAHLAYATSVAHGHVPAITDVPTIDADAVQWRAEQRSAKDRTHRMIWVANHPPGHYLAAAPLVWIAELTHRADGGLLFMRLLNVAFAAVGIMFTYLLGAEIASGRRSVGVMAAALAGLLPYGHVVFGEGLNDGLAFAAGTAVVWAGVRALRRRSSRRELVLLGVCATAAAGARTVTMLLAVAVVLTVAGFTLISRAGWGRGDGRVRGGGRVVLFGLGPPAVLVGWFYVRIAARYGDIGASAFLLDMFGRRRRGSIAEMLTWGHTWSDLYHRLFSQYLVISTPTPVFVDLLGALAIIGVVLALVMGRLGSGPGVLPRRLDRRAALLLVGGVALTWLTTAQHVSNGGNAYARYFFPSLGCLAVLAVIGLDRLVPRLLPAAAVALLAVRAVRSMRHDVDPTAITRPRDRGQGGVMPAVLQVLPGSDAGRAVAMAMVVVGLTLLAAVTLWAAALIVRDTASRNG